MRTENVIIFLNIWLATTPPGHLQYVAVSEHVSGACAGKYPLNAHTLIHPLSSLCGLVV